MEEVGFAGTWGLMEIRSFRTVASRGKKNDPANAPGGNGGCPNTGESGE